MTSQEENFNNLFNMANFSQMPVGLINPDTIREQDKPFLERYGWTEGQALPVSFAAEIEDAVRRSVEKKSALQAAGEQLDVLRVQNEERNIQARIIRDIKTTAIEDLLPEDQVRLRTLLHEAQKQAENMRMQQELASKVQGMDPSVAQSIINQSQLMQSQSNQPVQPAQMPTQAPVNVTPKAAMTYEELVGKVMEKEQYVPEPVAEVQQSPVYTQSTHTAVPNSNNDSRQAYMYKPPQGPPKDTQTVEEEPIAKVVYGEGDPAPSNEDIVKYVEATLMGEAYTKTYTLLGGRMAVTFQNISNFDLESIRAELLKDQREAYESGNPIASAQITATDAMYVVCLSVKSVKVWNPATQQWAVRFASPGNGTFQDWKNVYQFTKVRQVYELLLNSLNNAAMWEVFHGLYGKFAGTIRALAVQAENANFWNATL